MIKVLDTGIQLQLYMKAW